MADLLLRERVAGLPVERDYVFVTEQADELDRREFAVQMIEQAHRAA